MPASVTAEQTVDVLVRQARMRAALPAGLAKTLLGLAADEVARHELIRAALDTGNVGSLFEKRPRN